MEVEGRAKAQRGEGREQERGGEVWAQAQQVGGQGTGAVGEGSGRRRGR